MNTSTTPRVHERDVVVNGVRLHVREVGSPDASPVLFLHGMMGHCRDWDVLIDRLGERHRVIVVDQRGHGRSAWARRYRVGDMADDAIALIEHIEVSPVPIVGHSMGAMVAMVIASRRPDLVERIALIDIVPESLATDFGEQLPAMLEEMAGARYANIDDAVADWQAGNPLARTDLLRNYVRHALVSGPDGSYRWGFDALGLRSFAAGVNPDELRAAAAAVTCPALVVRGEHSSITTPDQAASLARRLGDAHTVTIGGGGHDLGVEQPEAVTDAVLEFLPPAHVEEPVR